MITSTKNPRVKHIRHLQADPRARRESNSFVLEGIRLCEEAVAAGWPVQLCLFDQDLPPRGREIVDQLAASGVETIPAMEHVIKAVSETKTPQGLVMVVEYAEFKLPEAPNLILVLDEIQDPGNAGSLLRSAAAAGADGIILTAGSVDPFSPKVLRAGMGAHFRLPLAVQSPAEMIAFCREHGLALWASLVDDGEPYTEADLAAPLAVVIGSEAHGVGPEIRAASKPVHIAMPGGGESLNAAAAGAVLLFEVQRQRNQ